MANHSQLDIYKIDLQLFSEEIEEDFLPDDFDTPVEEQDDFEVEAEETTEVETPVEPVVEQRKLKLKYNHEEKEVTEEEATILAQKGLNYDKVVEKLNQLQNDERLTKYDKVKQLSELYGMSEDDMLNSLYNQYYESTAQAQGLTPEQIRKEHEIKQREDNLRQQETAKMQEQRQKQELNDFVNTFPDVKPADIKPETWAKVQSGMPLKYAYMEQERLELVNKMKVLEQNLNNKTKAPISGVTAHGSAEVAETDPFLEGFNSED